MKRISGSLSLLLLVVATLIGRPAAGQVAAPSGGRAAAGQAPASSAKAAELAAKASRLAEEGKLTEAEALLTEASKLNPNDPTIAFNLGEVCAAIPDYACAKLAYQLYLMLAPNAPDTTEVRAKLTQLQQQSETPTGAAAEEFRDHIARGKALFKLNRVEDAVTEFRRAKDLDPNCHICDFNLGLAEERLKQPRLAASYYKQYLPFAAPDEADEVREKVAEMELASETPPPPQHKSEEETRKARFGDDWFAAAADAEGLQSPDRVKQARRVYDAEQIWVEDRGTEFVFRRGGETLTENQFIEYFSKEIGHGPNGLNPDRGGCGMCVLGSLLVGASLVPIIVGFSDYSAAGDPNLDPSAQSKQDTASGYILLGLLGGSLGFVMALSGQHEGDLPTHHRLSHPDATNLSKTYSQAVLHRAVRQAATAENWTPADSDALRPQEPRSGIGVSFNSGPNAGFGARLVLSF